MPWQPKHDCKGRRPPSLVGWKSLGVDFRQQNCRFGAYALNMRGHGKLRRPRGGRRFGIQRHRVTWRQGADKALIPDTANRLSHG